ncbi:MAG: ABC transporter ATP-binding protein [Bryobacterales bacterium]|nr:ABC transporter ATP-binding protein [Bryobacterales bacterium]
MSARLSIERLQVSYRHSAVDAPVLRDLHLEVGAGEAVGICGVSGSGKTTLARAILRLLPASAAVMGRVEFDGQELLEQPAEQLRRLRGRRISLISQEPSACLNPFARALAQVEEVVRAHGAAGDARAVLRRFFDGDAERIANAYPHELSGGERQRLVICQAMVCGPALLIADEPTVALDSVAQKAFLDLLRELRETTGLSLLLVSHNRAALRYVTDRSLELREGQLR